ncbi:MAG TPA: trypsin-like peptidase domain-containing protein [Candidatus Limnocylindria bacterium]|nr:trypsin-like peptidase domain-containing protein [Candidatus Limnocylindria bacterium]
MTGSKSDRPYGNFPRYGIAPAEAALAETTPLTRRQRVGAWLRARSRRERVEMVITAILVAAAIFLSLSALPKGYELGTVDTTAPTPTPTIPELYAKLAQTVVTVRADLPDGKTSLGSGVIIDDAADILTALHVVTDASKITVTFADGSTYEAQIFARQPQNDIAGIRAMGHPDQMAIATMGNANALNVGDDAIVIGNPFGLSRSLSTGVISGLHRSIQPPGADKPMTELIQFDASVNPGNSGGPLFNRDGDVVGIVSGLANPNGQASFSGIGFAVTIQAAGGAVGLPPD